MDARGWDGPGDSGGLRIPGLGGGASGRPGRRGPRGLRRRARPPGSGGEGRTAAGLGLRAADGPSRSAPVRDDRRPRQGLFRGRGRRVEAVAERGAFGPHQSAGRHGGPRRRRRGEPGGAAPGRVGLGAGRLLEGPRGGPGLLRLDRPGIAPDGDRRVSRARRTGLLRNGRSRRGRVQRRERRLGARGGGRAPVASNGRGPTGAGAAQPADGPDRIGGQAPVVDAGGRGPRRPLRRL